MPLSDSYCNCSAAAFLVSFISVSMAEYCGCCTRPSEYRSRSSVVRQRITVRTDASLVEQCSSKYRHMAVSMFCHRSVLCWGPMLASREEREGRVIFVTGLSLSWLLMATHHTSHDSCSYMKTLASHREVNKFRQVLGIHGYTSPRTKTCLKRKNFTRTTQFST